MPPRTVAPVIGATPQTPPLTIAPVIGAHATFRSLQANLHCREKAIKLWRVFLNDIDSTHSGIKEFLDCYCGDPEKAAQFFSLIHGFTIPVDSVQSYLNLNIYGHAENLRQIINSCMIGKAALVAHDDKKLRISDTKMVVYSCIENAQGLEILKKRMTDEKAGHRPLFSTPTSMFGLLGRDTRYYRMKNIPNISSDMLFLVLEKLEKFAAAHLSHIRYKGPVYQSKWSGPQHKDCLNAVHEVLNEENTLPTPTSPDVSDAEDDHKIAFTKDEDNKVYSNLRKPKKFISKKHQKHTNGSKIQPRDLKLISAFLDEAKNIKWDKVLLQYLDKDSIKVSMPRRVISDDVAPSLLKYSISIAYPLVTDFINQTDIPIDVLLAAGRMGRAKLNLDILFSNNLGNVVATCTPLLSQKSIDLLLRALLTNEPYLVAAAMVADIKDAYSPEFKAAYLDVMDREAWCLEQRNSKQGNYRCSYLSCQKDEKPVIKLGTYAIVGVPAEELEAILFHIHTELANMYTSATRETMRRILGISDPDNYVSWETHYDNVASLIKEHRRSTPSRMRQISSQLAKIHRENEKSVTGILEEFKHVLSRVDNAAIPAMDKTAVKANHGAPSNSAKRRSDRKKQAVIPATDNTTDKVNHAAPSNSAKRTSEKKNNKHLKSMGLYHAISDNVKDDLIFNCDDCLPYNGTVQIIKNGEDASYAPHKDASYILNSRSHKAYNVLGNGKRLPTIDEMAVFTSCLCTDGYQGYTSLRHTDTRTAETLTDIKIYESHVHIQSPYCQSGDYKHQSNHVRSEEPRKSNPTDGLMMGAANKKASNGLRALIDNDGDPNDDNADDDVDFHQYLDAGSGGIRGVFTSRECALPLTDKVAYGSGIVDDGLYGFHKRTGETLYNVYDQTHVFSSREKLRYPVILEPHKTTNHADTVPAKGSKGKKDCLLEDGLLEDPPKFAPLTLQDQHAFHRPKVSTQKELPCGPFHEFVAGIKKPAQYAGMRPTRAQVALQSRIVERFLKRHKLPKIAWASYGCDQFKCQNTYDILFCPNNLPILPYDIISTVETGMKKYFRSKKVVDKKHPWIITLEQLYKSIPYTIDLALHYFHRLRQWLVANCHMRDPQYHASYKRFEEEYESLLEIITFGSGGSAAVPGCYSLDDRTVGPKDCHHTTGSPQSEYVAENSAFLWLNRMEAPFALLFNMHNFLNKAVRRETDRSKLDDSAPGKNRYINDKIHAANEFINNLIDSNEIMKDQYVSLFYWQIKSITIGRCRSKAALITSFQEVPGFLKQNTANTSFRLEKAFELRLGPAFSFATTVQTVQNQLGDMTTAYSVCYVVQDPVNVKLELSKVQRTGIVTSSESDLEAMKGYPGIMATKGDSRMAQYPISWVNTETMAKHLCSVDSKDFDEAMLVSDMPLEARTNSFTLKSVAQLAALMSAVMLSAAARANPTRSTRDNDVSLKDPRKKKRHVIPLVCSPRVEELPDSLRLCGMPLPNSDFDVLNWFFIANSRQLESVLVELHRKPTLSRVSMKHHAYKTVDYGIKNNRLFVADLVLMATVLRMTGDVPHLAEFGNYVKLHGNKEQIKLAGLNLPIFETLPLFITFLDAFPSTSFSNFLSVQHAGMVPETFKQPKKGSQTTGLENFKTFLRSFGSRSDNGGMAKMEYYLLTRGKEIDRAHLVNFLSNEIADSAMSNCDNSVKWCVSKILCDVETILHDSLGVVDYESLGFGTGSTFGQQVMARTISGGFHIVHEKILAGISDLPVFEKRILGWYTDDDGILRSTLTGRKYTMADTEHIFCKIYICARLVHPSVTKGEKKGSFPSYCWPLYKMYDWLSPIIHEFDSIWEGFESSQNWSFLKDNFPPDFAYQESYWMKDDDLNMKQKPKRQRTSPRFKAMPSLVPGQLCAPDDETNDRDTDTPLYEA